MQNEFKYLIYKQRKERLQLYSFVQCESWDGGNLHGKLLATRFDCKAIFYSFVLFMVCSRYS